MRSTAMSMSFPPLTRAVKTLVIINIGIFLLSVILNAVGQGAIVAAARDIFGLVPAAVTHGWVWQVVSYSFLHADLFHVLFNMLSLWWIGATLEQHWGSRQFTEFYLFCVIGAAVSTIVIAYTAAGIFRLSPNTLTIGASGGVYGILMAFGILYKDREFWMFPFPFMIKAKYMIMIWILIALVGSLQGPAGVAYVAHLGGLLFGYLYVRFVPRAGLTYAASEYYFGWRNAYHRHKRRQAAKKFEVYMRKHQHDPKQYFDEYGNFRPPSDLEKKDDDGGKWVN
jgi:membrane associated rhomboid family serine protease